MKRGFIRVCVYCLPFFILTCNEDDTTPPCGGPPAFEGVWTITENCGGTDQGYPLTITADTTGKITLSNLGGSGSVMKANVSGGNFTLIPQNVQGYIINGNGSLNAGCTQIVFTWAGSPKGSCTCTGTK